MQAIGNIESKAASLFAKLPKLPNGLRLWLAGNVWWIVLIGVILGAIGLLGLLSIVSLAVLVLIGWGGTAGAVLAGLTVIAAIALLATASLALVNLVLMTIAIGPLKARRHKGWYLLFLVWLISIISLIVGFLLTFEIFSFTTGLLFSVVFGYVLFQIREFFLDRSARIVEGEVVS